MDSAETFRENRGDIRHPGIFSREEYLFPQRTVGKSGTSAGYLTVISFAPSAEAQDFRGGQDD
jgi:hypothetical protein